MIPFGQTETGEMVHKIVLAEGDLTVSLITWGAVIQDVRLAGVPYGLTLGSDLLSDYEGEMRYHGSLIGPAVNRITNAEAVIGGKVCRFEKNLDGRHFIHSGVNATHLKVWKVVETGPTRAVLALDLPDGEGNFPGNRRVVAEFTVEAPATLTQRVTMTTDATTIVNFANHSYWNLDGTGRYDGHWLKVAADRYLPADELFIPTGEIVDVTGTGMDLREGRTIGIHDPDFDNCYCLADNRTDLRDVLWLRGASGLTLTMATTSPGMHVYDGRHAIRPGRSPFEGLAFEAEYWPDATSNPTFPSIEITPEQVYDEITQWRFGRA